MREESKLKSQTGVSLHSDKVLFRPFVSAMVEFSLLNSTSALPVEALGHDFLDPASTVAAPSLKFHIVVSPTTSNPFVSFYFTYALLRLRISQPSKKFLILTTFSISYFNHSSWCLRIHGIISYASLEIGTLESRNSTDLWRACAFLSELPVSLDSAAPQRKIKLIFLTQSDPLSRR